MKEIVNKTQRPLRVPHPGGKFLFLGPAKSGQVSDQAVQAPSLKKLLDARETANELRRSTRIEFLDEC